MSVSIRLQLSTAVRIELVESLEATAFLNCFRRFLCLTGNKTCHIRSDGATTFVGAKNILDRDLAKTKTKATNSIKVQNFSREAGVIWDFSTPAASHHQAQSRDRFARSKRSAMEFLVQKITSSLHRILNS